MTWLLPQTTHLGYKRGVHSIWWWYSVMTHPIHRMLVSQYVTVTALSQAACSSSGCFFHIPRCRRQPCNQWERSRTNPWFQRDIPHHWVCLPSLPSWDTSSCVIRVFPCSTPKPRLWPVPICPHFVGSSAMQIRSGPIQIASNLHYLADVLITLFRLILRLSKNFWH